MPTKTRCLFECVAITTRKHWIATAATGEPSYVYDAEFTAVLEGEANREFWEATPSGALKVGTIRADHFVVGRKYWLDLELVEAADLQLLEAAD